MKNVIIGTALNYGVNEIKNFVLSFRKYNKDAEIFLIYDMSQIDRIELFAVKHNITLMPFTNAAPNIHVVASRFVEYLKLVESLNGSGHFLLADIRDVIFQSDPFVNLPNEDYIFAFTEDPAVTIDIEPHHIKMIERMYGSQAMDIFRGKKIICSGTILGTKNGMVDFLKVFTHHLLELQKVNPQVCYEMLLDQVITNYILHNAPNPSCTIKDNGDIIGTIGHCITYPTPSGKLELKDGVFYLDGKVPAVIHQYDRSPEYFRQISELYNVD